MLYLGGLAPHAHWRSRAFLSEGLGDPITDSVAPRVPKRHREAPGTPLSWAETDLTRRVFALELLPVRAGAGAGAGSRPSGTSRSSASYSPLLGFRRKSPVPLGPLSPSAADRSSARPACPPRASPLATGGSGGSAFLLGLRPKAKPRPSLATGPSPILREALTGVSFVPYPGHNSRGDRTEASALGAGLWREAREGRLSCLRSRLDGLKLWTLNREWPPSR